LFSRLDNYLVLRYSFTKPAMYIIAQSQHGDGSGILDSV